LIKPMPRPVGISPSYLRGYDRFSLLIVEYILATTLLTLLHFMP
jgi:hypothetical protein